MESGHAHMTLSRDSHMLKVSDIKSSQVKWVANMEWKCWNCHLFGKEW